MKPEAGENYDRFFSLQMSREAKENAAEILRSHSGGLHFLVDSRFKIFVSTADHFSIRSMQGLDDDEVMTEGYITGSESNRVDISFAPQHKRMPERAMEQAVVAKIKQEFEPLLTSK
jgi:hypothetical protein